MIENWWQPFFAGPWQQVQRASHSEEQNRREADFIRQVLNVSPGRKVLDVPCGTGRVGIELAARGCKVTGVDITPEFLDQARDEAMARRLECHWVRADMRELPYSGEFDAAFCWWGSFGYFDDAGNRAFAEGMVRAIRPGGRILIDTPCCESLFPTFRSWDIYRVSACQVLEDRLYNPLTGRLDGEWTISAPGGRAGVYHSSIRIYTCKDLIDIFTKAGLKDFECYGNLDGAPFAIGSPRLYLSGVRAE